METKDKNSRPPQDLDWERFGLDGGRGTSKSTHSLASYFFLGAPIRCGAILREFWKIIFPLLISLQLADIAPAVMRVGEDLKLSIIMDINLLMHLKFLPKNM